MKTEIEVLSPFLPQDLLNDINDDLSDSISSKSTNSSLKHSSHSNSFNSSSSFSENRIDASIPQSYSPFQFPNINITEMLMNYTGSQILQQQLNTMTHEQTFSLLMNISQDLPLLMCNSYGNYFLQKLIKNSNSSQRVYILQSIEHDFVQIAQNVSGIHCIHCLLDKCSSKEELKLIKNNIKDHLLELSIQQNSTHFIQKLIGMYGSRSKYLTKFIISNFCILCTHLHGATVLKKYISEIEDNRIKQVIISLLEQNFFQMCQNQYANYMIQYSIEIFGYFNCQSLINKILENILILSIEKYSSNVIDKIIVQIHQNNYPQFQQLLSFIFCNPSSFSFLNSSKFGNFVLLNMLKLVTPNDKMIIRTALLNNKPIWNNQFIKIFNYL